MKELDPRLVLAFNAHRTRLWSVYLARALTIAGLLSLALYVSHWGTWTAFGVIGFMQAAGLIALVLVSRMPDRFRARLETDARELAWLHTAAEPRALLGKLLRLERAASTTAAPKLAQHAAS